MVTIISPASALSLHLFPVFLHPVCPSDPLPCPVFQLFFCVVLFAVGMVVSIPSCLQMYVD